MPIAVTNRKVFIYKITCLVNDKIYIGQAVDPQERWWKHIANSRKEIPDAVINRAMKKYGPENFKMEIIRECENLEEANAAEIELIKEYDSTNENIGYNIAPGGQTYRPKYIKSKNATSQYLGVSERRKKGTWAAHFVHEGLKIAVGEFKTEIEAAEAWDWMALKILKDEATTNFDKEFIRQKYGEDGPKKRKRKSPYMGVVLEGKKYAASVWKDYKKIHIARFDSEIDAAEARDLIALNILGEDTKLNFDKEYILNKKDEILKNIQESKGPEKTSKYRGVSFMEKGKGFSANIRKGDDRIYIGYFTDEIAAAIEYDKKAVELFGEKAILNFPENFSAENGYVSDYEAKERIIKKNHYKPKNSSSQYLGVVVRKPGKKYEATYYDKEKKIIIGVFDSEINAALIRDSKMLELYGENVELNFPKDEILSRKEEIQKIFDQRIKKSSVYKGLSWFENNQYWMVNVYLPNKQREYVGSFRDELEAAKAYDKRAWELLGTKAKLNFPEDYNQNSEE